MMPVRCAGPLAFGAETIWRPLHDGLRAACLRPSIHRVHHQKTGASSITSRSLDQLGIAHAGLALFRIDDMQCRAGSPHAHLHFLPGAMSMVTESFSALDVMACIPGGSCFSM